VTGLVSVIAGRGVCAGARRFARAREVARMEVSRHARHDVMLDFRPRVCETACDFMGSVYLMC
jgi:hypothetical protein